MVKVSYYGYKVCGSQRDKAKIVALWACKTAFNKKSAEQGTSPYSALKVHYIGVLSDDFAAVDFREDYANLSLPKEAKFKRCRTIKTNERKPCAAEKRQPVPKRVSGDGSAPPRLRFGFSVIPFRGVCLAAAPEREARRFVVRR